MNSWNLKSMAQVIAYLLFSRNILICDKLLKNIMYSTKLFSIFPKIMVIRTCIPMFHSFPPQGTCKRQYLSFPKGFCKIYLHNPEQFAPLEVQPVIQEACKIWKMQKVRPHPLIYLYLWTSLKSVMCKNCILLLAWSLLSNVQWQHCYWHIWAQKCAHSRENTQILTHSHVFARSA